MKQNYPITPAVRLLREKQIDFVPHLYPYEEHGGTKHAAEVLHFAEHAIIKTLVMETETRSPLIVLMHGDREVSTRQLARVLSAKHVTPCEPTIAQKHTGYLVGGTSPFGTRTALPVYVEVSIFSLERVYINGGKRGFLVELASADLKRAISLQEVEVAIEA
jgi:Cys-tRNA(Pro) deacylase